MRATTISRAACLALGLVLLGAGCSGPKRVSSAAGRPGGTLRVLVSDIQSLDTATVVSSWDFALAHAYARTLYGYDLAGPPERVGVPVPDIASGPPRLSADRRTYTFRLRGSVRYAPPVNHEVRAQDFITAVERLYDKATPSPGRQYADLIAGARQFGAGTAKRIAGLAAPDARTLRITLVKPAGDFLSILAAEPFFAPVPREYAANYAVGANYSGHMVGSGPYTLARYVPNRIISLIRNSNWDPATDPLRTARVDRIEVKLGSPASAVQQAIERGEADLSLGSHVPATRVAALRADRRLSGRLAVVDSGCLTTLALGTHRAAGAVADVRVRRAINYAIDKVAVRDALGGRYAPDGEIASTILTPGDLGYHKYDLYPTPGSRGDPARARTLLAEAGYPDGLTLGFVNMRGGQFAAATTPIRTSLAQAGIRLKITTYEDGDLWIRSLALPSKRLEHQIGLTRWCPEWPGDNARSTIVPQLDGRLINPRDNSNFSEYDNPAVNRLIDQALAEPDRDRRAALWGQIDERVMRDAPWVPLMHDRWSYFWSSRVRNWVFNSWTAMPELTTVWLDPPSP